VSALVRLFRYDDPQRLVILDDLSSTVAIAVRNASLPCGYVYAGSLTRADFAALVFAEWRRAGADAC
jgi:hypothetical protein